MSMLNNLSLGRFVVSIGVSLAILASLPGGIARAKHIQSGIVGGIIGGIIATCASGGCKRKERARREYRKERPRYRTERPRYKSERPHHKKRKIVKKKRVKKYKARPHKVTAAKKKKSVVVARKPVLTADHFTQRDLKSLGFYSGAINGNLASSTSKEAITDYQGTFGLELTGQLVPEERDILKQQAALQNVRTYFDNPDANSGRAMKRKIQAALNVLGLYKDKIDGSIGPKSRKSIIAFQQDNGYAPTGKLKNSQTELLFSIAIAEIKTLENDFRLQLASIGQPSVVDITDNTLLGFDQPQEVIETTGEPEKTRLPAAVIDKDEPVIKRSITITAANEEPEAAIAEKIGEDIAAIK